jgi:hypothetical protein
MPADTTAAVIAAARHRHELTRAKAIRALRELAATSTPITFQTVATAAGVSRSWLYTQPDIRRDIERQRDTRTTPKPLPTNTNQRSSDASLAARLQAANQRIRELNEDNQRLRRQLARALGDQRAISTHPPARG